MSHERASVGQLTGLDIMGLGVGRYGPGKGWYDCMSHKTKRADLWARIGLV